MLILGFLDIFHGWHFENGLGEVMYSQIVIADILICYENIYYS